MIELKDVCFAYNGIPALRHIDLKIEKGETVILRGGNGCGKTTLIKLLNGLIFAEEGEYTFDGKPVNAKTMKDSGFSKAFHRQLGYVFQDPDAMLFCPSVEEEIAFGPRQMGLSEEETARRTEDMLKLLGIEELRDRAPYHLSGGEKRKVSLACILSMAPSALILDEPLAGLDEDTQNWLTEFLKALKMSGKTMVIATHSSILTDALADRIVYMDKDHRIERIEKVREKR